MASGKTPSKKATATPKMTNRGVTVAVKAKQVRAKKKRPIAPPSMSAQEQQMLVAQAAYFRAERRGFAPGGELQDWVEAEAELLRPNGDA
jgi:hypothetical protein